MRQLQLVSPSSSCTAAFLGEILVLISFFFFFFFFESFDFPSVVHRDRGKVPNTTRSPFLSFFFYVNNHYFYFFSRSGFGDLFVSQNHREFYAFRFLRRNLVCASTMVDFEINPILLKTQNLNSK